MNLYSTKRWFSRSALIFEVVVIVLILANLFWYIPSHIDKDTIKQNKFKAVERVVVTTTTSTTTTTLPPTTTTSTVPVVKTKVADVSSAPPVIIESHELLMESAGIPSDEWWAVELLIQKESGWNPTAVNGGGCKGLGQNCGSWLAEACPDWQTNPVCQLRRFDQYVRERYSNWPMAWAHSERVGWY